MEYKLPISAFKSGKYDARTLYVASYLYTNRCDNKIITCVNFITLGIGLYPNRGRNKNCESIKTILKRLVKEKIITIEGDYKNRISNMLIIRFNMDSELFCDSDENVIINNDIIYKLSKTKCRNKDSLFVSYIASKILSMKNEDISPINVVKVISPVVHMTWKAVNGYLITLSTVL